MQTKISRTRVFLTILPAILCLILAMAHFFRASNDTLVICSALIIPLLIFLRRQLTLKITQLALALITIEWCYTTYQFVIGRIEMDRPWTRLAVIMGAVICFNLISIIMLSKKRLTEHYKR